MIRRFDMIREGDTILAGVSGGADSVCLLHILWRLQGTFSFSLRVMHVEHGIRGEESLRDADFVRGLCEERGIPCRIAHVDAAALSREKKWSLEEAARFARFREFEREAARTGASAVAAAHHSGDQAETVLLNLTRGSGLRGLGGMHPVSALPWSRSGISLIRPLLSLSREEIEENLRSWGIGWQTDSTNLQEQAVRNRLRLHVMPYLTQSVNPLAQQHICEAAFHLQKAQAFIERQALQTCAGRIRSGAGRVTLDVDGLAGEEEIIREYILREFLSRGYEALKAGAPADADEEAVREGWYGLKDISGRHYRMLLSLMDSGRSASCDLPGGMKVRRRGKYLVLSERDAGGDTAAEASPGGKNEPDPCVRLPYSLLPGEKRTARFGGYCFETSLLERSQMPAGQAAKTQAAQSPGPEEVWRFSFEPARPGAGELYLRYRREGDYLVIDREGHRQSLKKYMINAKIPADERGGRILLAQGAHIWQVQGGRRSEAVRPGGAEPFILEIALWKEKDQ